MKRSGSVSHTTIALAVAAFMWLPRAQAGQFQITTNNARKLSASAAFDGTNYLVAIQGDNLFSRANTNAQIAARFVSQSGTLVGPLIDLGRNAGPSSFSPWVAFDGTNHLVVWSDSTNAPSDDVYGQLISTSGALVGSSFPISQAPNSQAVHGVVFDGTNYFVVWDDNRRGSNGVPPFDIYGQRVSTSGTNVGGEIRISPADDTRDHENGRVVFDGVNYFVAWRENLTFDLNVELRGQFVSPSGTMVNPVITINADGVKIDTHNSPAIGVGATNLLVSWYEDVSSTERDLLGQCISRTGALVGGVFTISAAPANANGSFIASDGVNYLVTWVDSLGSTNQSCKARFLDSAGNPVSFEFAPFVAQGTNPPVFSAPFFDGKRYFLIGDLGIFKTSGDLYGAFAAPFSYGTFPIAITSGAEQGFSAAFDGVNYLVGIQGDAAAHYNITAQLVSTNGVLVGPRISVGRTGGMPPVGFDGTNYLLVWEDDATSPNDHIYGQRISKSGALVGGAFQISATSATRQNFNYSLQPLAFDGTNFLVVWQDQGAGGTNESIVARFVTTSGTLSGSEIAIAPGPGEQAPAVAFDGTNYLVVWQKNDRGDGTTDAFNTYGKLISTAGVAGASFLISQNSSTYYFPTTLAFDGTNYFVTLDRTTEWPPLLSPPASLDIFGRFVSPAGAVVGNEFPITTAPGSQWFPIVLLDGTDYLVSWGDVGGISPTVKCRYFNRSGAPVGSEFSLFGSQGASRLTFFAGASSSGGRLFMVASYLTSKFGGGDVYGLFIPPARLDIAKPVGGRVPLRLSGMPGLAYQVQAKTNPVPSGSVWAPVTNISLTNADFNFTDSTGLSRRFYRAVQQ